MSQTNLTRDQLKTNRTIVPIGELKLWDKNPREVIDSERVMADMRGVQTVPLLVMADGTILGGNTRFQGMQAVGRPEVWVSVVEFDEENGKYIPYINGERDIKEFSSVDDGMKHYALKNNQEYARYLQLELVELALDSQLNLEEYTVRPEDNILVSLKSIMDDSNGVDESAIDETKETENELGDQEDMQGEVQPKSEKKSKVSYTLTYPVELVASTEFADFETWLTNQLDELMLSMLDQFKKVKDAKY